MQHGLRPCSAMGVCVRGELVREAAVMKTLCAAKMVISMILPINHPPEVISLEVARGKRSNLHCFIPLRAGSETGDPALAGKLWRNTLHALNHVTPPILR